MDQTHHRQYDPKLSAAAALSLLHSTNEEQVRKVSQLPEDDGSSITNIFSVIRDLLVAVLHLDESDIDEETPLLDYGLDSIASTEIGNKLSEKYGIVVPPTIFFEFGNLGQFVSYLKSNFDAILASDLPSDEEASASKHLARDRAVSKQHSSQTNISERRSYDGNKETRTSARTIEELWKASEQDGEELGGGAAVTAVQANGLEKQRDTREEIPKLILSSPRGQATEFVVVGNGPPLLLLGGLLIEYDVMWSRQIEVLARNFRLIMVQMPGCGAIAADHDITMEELCDGIRDVIRALNLSNGVGLIGYSFGTRIALALIARYPDAFSALCICASGCNTDHDSDFRALISEMQSVPKFMELNRNWNIGAMPKYRNVMNGVEFRQTLHSIRVPTLVIGAKDDYYQPIADIRELAKQIPNSTIVEISDGGHLFGYTRATDVNEYFVSFFSDVYSMHKSNLDAQSLPWRPINRFLPTSAETLSVLRNYIERGGQGHCAILSPQAAQAAYLLNRVIQKESRPDWRYHTYFLTSIEEAFDAGIRIARHYGRTRDVANKGRVGIYDPTCQWRNMFNPHNASNEHALVPNLEYFDTITELMTAVESAPSAHYVAAALGSLVGLTDISLHEISSIARANESLLIAVEHGGQQSEPQKWASYHCVAEPDIMVFGECIAGHQVPVAAMMIRSDVRNPWSMTPNEGYARHVMADFGFPLAVVCSYMLRHLGSELGELGIAAFDQIAESPRATYEAHLAYGNVGYAKVARLHGFDGFFHEAHGLDSAVTNQRGETRKILDCFVNVGCAPRGLNPYDVLEQIARDHDYAYDYVADLHTFLSARVGLPRCVITSSNITAVEAALTIGLLASDPRKKLLCFNGGLGFTLVTGASSNDTQFNLFRAPFGPHFGNVVYVDWEGAGAQEELRNLLESGEVGFVWLEPIQVDANSSKRLPAELLKLVVNCRKAGGYLIGVDETMCGIVTGRFLNSSTTITDPDIVALGTALCDSLVPAGAMLTSNEVMDRARRTNGKRIYVIETAGTSNLAAHIAFHCLQTIERENLMERAQVIGRYFMERLTELSRNAVIPMAVRGEGLLITIEFETDTFDSFTRRSFGYLLWGVMLRDEQFGVAGAVCPIYNNCIRFLAPLTITETQIDTIISNLRRSLSIGVTGILANCASYAAQIGEERTSKFLHTLCA